MQNRISGRQVSGADEHLIEYLIKQVRVMQGIYLIRCLTAL